LPKGREHPSAGRSPHPSRAMKSLFVCLSAALASAPCAIGASVTPTQQVVNMLTDMKSQGAAMKDEEQKVFAQYAEWADDRIKETEFEIKTGTDNIEQLIALITKADSDVIQFQQKISVLDKEIGTLSTELKEASETRESQHTEYVQLSTDYGESVQALEGAIEVVSSQNYDREQGESLLQRVSFRVRATRSDSMAQLLAALQASQESTADGEASSSLRGGGSGSGSGAPEGAAYASQSSGLVDMLKGLLSKFKAELAEVQEAESNRAHEFALVQLHLKDTIAKDESDKKEKTIVSKKTQAESARAKGELAASKAQNVEDENMLADTTATLKAKMSAYEENQKVRTAELEAIAQALEIVSSPEVAGGSAAAASFLQLRSSRRSSSDGQRVADFLQSKALALNSRALASLSADMAESPFAKVVEMIEGMIEKMKQEAAEEADHKAWCDEQLKENKLKRDKKSAQSNTLSADIDGLSAKIADMENSVTTLVKEQADLTSAMQGATALRETEKAENAKTVADATAGMSAVQKALVILKEFYSAKGEAFLQQVPELKSYKGMASGGVIGMLEVIESDFSRLKMETAASEKVGAAEYDRFMAESTSAKESKHKVETKLRLDKDQSEFDRVEAKKDLDNVSQELAKANEYFEDLKPACLQVKVSHADRAARRQEEIEALKEAYSILGEKAS